MKRFTLALALTAVAAAAVLATGCVTNPAEAEKSSDPDVWGYVASADKAKLEIDEDQMDATTLVVDKVLAPQDAWIVVHLDDNGKPGMRVGLKHVKKGESLDVKVKLDKVTTDKVIVALHSDRAKQGKFDFDMMAPKMSSDRPYFVDEKELARVVTVRGFGVPDETATASVEVADQPGVEGSLLVAKVSSPTDAWIVVHLDDDGAPGSRVGLQHISAGESVNVPVELYPLPLTDKLFIAVHADRGENGVFEFDMMDKINSADQPFFVDGAEVAVAAQVR